jgi:hypothetical protein
VLEIALLPAADRPAAESEAVPPAASSHEIAVRTERQTPAPRA